MSLAQDIRNAFDWRDRDALEHALHRLQAIEEAAKPVGRCELGDRCNCGGDLPRIQAACSYWKGPPRA